MRNQFFCKYQEGEEGKELPGSFPLNSVLFTVEYAPGKLMIALNDWHVEERPVEIPITQGKNKGTGTRVEWRKMEVTSKVFLNEEDSTRYRKTTEVVWQEPPEWMKEQVNMLKSPPIETLA